LNNIDLQELISPPATCPESQCFEYELDPDSVVSVDPGRPKEPLHEKEEIFCFEEIDV
jgi:hypothetical protein